MTKLDKIMFTVVPGVLVEWELVVVFQDCNDKKRRTYDEGFQYD